MIDQVKGTRNLYGKDIDNYLHIKDKFLNCYASYGYKFVELPNIEHKDLFTKSIVFLFISPVTKLSHILFSKSHIPIQAGPAHHSKAVLNFLPLSTFSNIGANIGPHPSKSGVDSILFSHSLYLFKGFYNFWAFCSL